MGQQQFSQLKQKLLQCDQQNSHELQTSEQLIAKLQDYASQVTNEDLTSAELKKHIFQYFNSQLQNGNPYKKRRRSYQLLQIHGQAIEKTRTRSDSFSRQYIELEQKMQWLEEIQELVRKNITEIMVTQKSYKIRQHFRKLILSLLKLDNLLIYIVHSQGRLEFHDFKANYITYVIEGEKSKSIEFLIKQYQGPVINPRVLQNFDLLDEAKNDEELYKWGVHTENPKVSICYVWKSHKDMQNHKKQIKVIKKIADIAMISSGEEEISVIQNYSKDLLELLQQCIYQCESEICSSLGLGMRNLQELYASLIGKKDKNQPLLARVNAYQQLVFQLLENIRTYKKYVCEGDKIFMDFNESAQLTFMSNNFNHPLTSTLAQIDDQKYYLQKIFQNYKPMNDFLKKAVQKKIKSNKLYELDFQTKSRVKYNQQGKIVRLNVIIEELDRSSSSNSIIYSSSSTKILSEDGEKQSSKDFADQEEEKRQKRPSTLIRNLQKQNPGIINQGWINLFIKDHLIANRKNTLMRNKQGKSYAVKRSFSLSHQTTAENEDPKAKLSHINIQSIDLDLLMLQEEQLQALVLKVFRKLQYYHTEHINKQYFQNFLNGLHDGYQIHNNSFHNFTHGVNVMHTCYILTQAAKIKQLLTPFKLFSIIFSGLCHDVGHTGFTNLFEIASHSKKAITYNDHSPLQNFHAAYTFQLLKKPENNFLKDITPQEMKEFRKSVINNILFTDIKEHFPLLKKFNALIKDEIPKNQEYMNTLTAMIVHTADFGGSAKDFEICKAWSLKVNLQFSNQYRMESQLGLTQTPFMKDLTNITILSKNQGGFLKVIVLPLYEAMDEYCGNDLKIKKLRQYAQKNIKRWQEIHVDSLKEQKKKQALKKEVFEQIQDQVRQDV